MTADPDEVAREAELFRTQGTAPFITRLEQQGQLPPWLRATMQAADPYALAALSTALATREGVADTLGRTTVPVLLLAGDRDPRLPSIRHTAAETPVAELVELPDCSRLDAFVRTDRTLPVIRPFLAGRPPRDTRAEDAAEGTRQ
ncbi:alpha/beta fold hydrolase [Actinomadura sp. BRA 177]|uniref:alpha/beta fold hydrolase n=1 Tax=Actinomadura sp. BRA 177 TaxID=2745202 RepID=UPI001595FDB5|nr:hypothetical protein [Actinomadura sp. BRA 177]NVI88691.1 hypothetical protein [Actinomadura sp. BRA 177]